MKLISKFSLLILMFISFDIYSQGVQESVHENKTEKINDIALPSLNALDLSSTTNNDTVDSEYKNLTDSLIIKLNEQNNILQEKTNLQNDITGLRKKITEYTNKSAEDKKKFDNIISSKNDSIKLLLILQEQNTAQLNQFATQIKSLQTRFSRYMNNYYILKITNSKQLLEQIAKNIDDFKNTYGIYHAKIDGSKNVQLQFFIDSSYSTLKDSALLLSNNVKLHTQTINNLLTEISKIDTAHLDVDSAIYKQIDNITQDVKKDTIAYVKFKSSNQKVNNAINDYRKTLSIDDSKNFGAIPSFTTAAGSREISPNMSILAKGKFKNANQYAPKLKTHLYSNPKNEITKKTAKSYERKSKYANIKDSIKSKKALSFESVLFTGTPSGGNSLDNDLLKSFYITDASQFGSKNTLTLIFTEPDEVEENFVPGFNMQINYLGKTLKPDSSHTINPGCLQLAMGVELRFFSGFSVYYNYNYTNIIDHVDDFRESYPHAAITNFYWDCGIRSLLYLPNQNDFGVLLDFNLMQINGDNNSLLQTKDVFIPSFKLGVRKTFDIK